MRILTKENRRRLGDPSAQTALRRHPRSHRQPQRVPMQPAQSLGPLGIAFFLQAFRSSHQRTQHVRIDAGGGPLQDRPRLVFGVLLQDRLRQPFHGDPLGFRPIVAEMRAIRPPPTP